MRKRLLILPLIFAGFTFSVDIPKLVKEKGCLNCHDIEKAKIGPPYKIIAKEYKNNPNAVKILVNSILHGSVGKWQRLGRKYGIRITAFYMPKRLNVSPEEAKKIVEWILSLEK